MQVPSGGRSAPSTPFGGGYTYLAIVADVHPTTQPGNTIRTLSTVSFLATLGTIIQISAQTTAHPIAYPA